MRTMRKTVTLIVPGAGEEAEARDAALEPGNTAADLLRAAGKNPDDWQIQLRRGDAFTSVSSREDLFGKVEDHEKVFVVPNTMVVG